MRAVKRYLCGCWQLLYWAYFKPSALRSYLEEIAPGIVSAPNIFDWEYETRHNLKLRLFLLEVALIAFALPLISYGLAGGISIALGRSFYWYDQFLVMILVVIIGTLLGGLFISEILKRVSVESAMVLGIGLGVGFGGGHKAIIAFALGLTLSLLISYEAGSVSGPLFSLVLGVISCFFLGIVHGIEVTIQSNLLSGIAAALGYIILGILLWTAGAVRLPFYLFEIFLAISTYRQSLTSDSPDYELRRSPIYFDELIVLPQPYLSQFLLYVIRRDFHSGLHHLAFAASNQFQAWAAQRALHKLLEQDKESFFFVLHQLLAARKTYHRVGQSKAEKLREADDQLTTKRLLTELTGINPIELLESGDIVVWLNSRLWKEQESQYAEYAKMYLLLLRDFEFQPDEEFASDISSYADILHEDVDFYEEEMELLSWAVQTLESARDLPYGEEFYQSFLAL